MVIQALAFYVFAAIAIAAGVMVVTSRNPVHSVLYLILAFFNASALFVLIGAEFVAMLLIVVYVGAVAVLFLFVVMMLDINYTELRQGFMRYLPFGLLLGLVLLAELVFVAGSWAVSGEIAKVALAPTPAVTETHNTAAIGNLIYTRYVYLFQAAGMVLLVAMIGAIVLTLRTRPGVKKQNIGEQIARRPEDVIEIVNVTKGGGV